MHEEGRLDVCMERGGLQPCNGHLDLSRTRGTWLRGRCGLRQCHSDGRGVGTVVFTVVQGG
jgi:hypothetical protein